MGRGNLTCPHCGRVIDSGDEYCLHCGIKLIEGEDSFTRPKQEIEGKQRSIGTRFSLGLKLLNKILLLGIFALLLIYASLCFGIALYSGELPVKITFFILFGTALPIGFGLLFLFAVKKAEKNLKSNVAIYENRITVSKKNGETVLFFINLISASKLKSGILLRFVQEEESPYVYVDFKDIDDRTKEFLLQKGYDVGMRKGETK